MPQAASAKDFLQAIWGDQIGVAELTTITPKAVKPQQVRAYGFIYPDSLDIFLNSAQAHSSRDLNVYFGVCLRREQWAQGSRGTEANALSSYAVWTDLDFAGGNHKGRTVDPKTVQKMLSEFPRKPSIVVRSGGGIHVYWLLKEAAVGAELVTVKKINRSLGKHLGGDSVADLARVLRLPGTANFNCTPPTMAEVSYWHPENRYLLDDFDMLPDADEPSPPAAQAPRPPEAPKQYHLGTVQDVGGHEPRPTPTSALDDDVVRMIGKLVGEIWFEGWRHDMALCVSGWLAFAGVKVEHAVEAVRIASDKVGGDTQKRLKDVQDTYKKYVEGGEVKGRPSLETMVDEAFPPLAKDKAKKTLVAIGRLLPKPKGIASRGFVEPDFKILWLIKYTSNPAIWTSTIEKGGLKIVTKCDHDTFSKYENFCQSVMDQNTISPAAQLKNGQWRDLINQAKQDGLYEEREAPAEMRTSGAIEKGLEEFLAESHFNPDVGLLKKFPGHDEREAYFRVETFRSFLSDQGRSFNPNSVTERLRSLGWESGIRRFGKKVTRVWFKSILNPDGGGDSNGNGNGNGHGGNGHGGNGHNLHLLPAGEKLPEASDLFPKEVAEPEA